MITASIVGPTFVTVMVNGQTMTIDGSHHNYEAIRAALKTKDHQLVETLINAKKAVENFAAGKVEVRGDRVFYGEMEVKGSVVHRILQMVREGFDSAPMLAFLANLMASPSKRAVDELYGFLEATGLPITEDGCFLAYKKVNHDYMDFYTGSVSNKLASLMSAAELATYPRTVGNVTTEIINGVTTLSMPRNQVDDERDRTCSNGLHFCSLSYLPEYHGGAGRVLIVKINPADVVSIPSDYDNAKGRTCRYEVIGEYEADDRERKDYFTSPVYNNTVPVTPTPSNTAPAAPTSKQPNAALTGYNTGRSDASNNREFNPIDGRFTGSAAVTYSESYTKGWKSVDKSFDEEDLVERMFEEDIDDNTYWYDEGMTQADADVAAGFQYDDTPPDNCSAVSEYKEGYADGWHAAKTARI